MLPHDQQYYDIGIVGAGLAGLTAARRQAYDGEDPAHSASLSDQAKDHYHLSTVENSLLKVAGVNIFKTLQKVARLVPHHILQRYTLGALLQNFFHFSSDFVALLR